MNALTQTPRRPRRRIAELDPFEVAADFEPRASYGCVDWYVYAEEEPRADARAPQAPAATPRLQRSLSH